MIYLLYYILRVYCSTPKNKKSLGIVNQNVLNVVTWDQDRHQGKVRYFNFFIFHGFWLMNSPKILGNFTLVDRQLAL